MRPPQIKKFFVPLRIWNCYGQDNPANLHESLMLVSLRPPNGCCGFLAVYPSHPEMQENHPKTSYVSLLTPVGTTFPAVVYRSRAIFPKQAFAYMLAYGTIEELRWQFPDGEYFMVKLPWPDQASDTDNLSGLIPESTPDTAATPPEWSLNAPDDPPPNWRF